MNLVRKTESLSVASLLAVTQTALGCGLGLLVANKLPRPARRIVAATMISVGAISTLPLLTELVLKRWRGPESERGMRKRLERIRDDSGIADELDEVF